MSVILYFHYYFMSEFLSFIEDFILHFPENEGKKVRELLEFLMNSKSRALENSDIEDLFYVFSETALKNSNFRYKDKKFIIWKIKKIFLQG